LLDDVIKIGSQLTETFKGQSHVHERRPLSKHNLVSATNNCQSVWQIIKHIRPQLPLSASQQWC